MTLVKENFAVVIPAMDYGSMYIYDDQTIHLSLILICHIGNIVLRKIAQWVEKYGFFVREMNVHEQMYVMVSAFGKY